MSLFLERVLSTKLQKNEVVQGSIKLTGGIDKEIYKVPMLKNGLHQSLAVSIFRNPHDWWKIDQEIVFREMLEGDKDAGIPELVDVGFDYLDEEKFAYIVRDFIEGQNLDIFLLSQPDHQSNERGIETLASDLGYKLAMLHRHKLSTFGRISKTTDETCLSWSDYILGKIDYYFKALSELPPEKGAGIVKVQDIVNIEQKLYKSLGSHQSSLYDQEVASLTHGDAHFQNFIASSNENGEWRIVGVIDTEEALGGDPEIDIAFLENWLYFTSYKEIFYKHKGDFLSGYNRNPPSPDYYRDRRYMYHALRSLSYLKALFTLDTTEIIRNDPKHQEYIEKHFVILRSLANGYALEDLNIKSLI